MRRILFMGLDAALAAVFLIPLFLAWEKRQLRNKRKAFCYVLFAMYLSAVYAVVGLPTVDYMRFDPNFNLVPFRYMFSDLTNSFLNVLLFLPLGLTLPLLWQAFGKFLPMVLFGFCTSLLIELLQIFTFRATDVNDPMTNTLGTILGWCCAKILLRLAPVKAAGWDSKELCVCCGAAFSVMFFVQPFLAKLILPILF